MKFLNLFKKSSRKSGKFPKNEIKLQEAKRKFPEFRYAVCNVMNGRLLWLCDTIESAKRAWETSWKSGGETCVIIDLWNKQIDIGKLKDWVVK